MAGIFGVAFIADQATAQRHSQVLGSTAIVISLLAVWPAARSIASAVTAYAGVWVGFNLLRALGDDVPWRDRWLDVVPALETWMAGGELPSIWLQRRLFDPLAIDWFDQVNTVVYLSFFVVPHVVAIALLLQHRARFWRYVAATALLFLIGAVSFALLPTSPPWLASSEDTGGVAMRLINLVLADAGLRADLPADGGATANHHAFEPNPVATIPSIHLGVTALLVPLALTWRWRAAAAVYTLAMGFSLVYLGEHYVLDAIAGALVAAVAWMGSARVLRMVRRGTRQLPGQTHAVPRLRIAEASARR